MSHRIPLEQAASRTEVEEAYRQLTKTERLRLSEYARRRSYVAHCSQEALMNAVVAAIFNPKDARRWRKESVDFARFLQKAIQSVSSNMAKARQRRLEGVCGEHETRLLEELPSRGGPEEKVVSRSVIDMVKAELKADDSLILEIMEGIEEGMKRRDIIEILDIKKQDYDTALRRLSRIGARLRKEGKHK